VLGNLKPCKKIKAASASQPPVTVIVPLALTPPKILDGDIFQLGSVEKFVKVT
jgi:hypothetical protein